MTTYRAHTILQVDCYFDFESENKNEAQIVAERMLQEGKANIQMPQTSMVHGPIRVTEIDGVRKKVFQTIFNPFDEMMKK